MLRGEIKKTGGEANLAKPEIKGKNLSLKMSKNRRGHS
jgi:hypothetical protein